MCRTYFYQIILVPHDKWQRNYNMRGIRQLCKGDITHCLVDIISSVQRWRYESYARGPQIEKE